jgi:hemoglobin
MTVDHEPPEDGTMTADAGRCVAIPFTSVALASIAESAVLLSALRGTGNASGDMFAGRLRTISGGAAQYDPRSVQTVYEAAGGYQGLLRLARAWHARVMADELVSHAFSHGFHPDHGERLAAYWAEALGGPTTFSAAYGDETSVVRLHSGNGVHEEMDRRAIGCFDEALKDAGFAGDDRLRQVLHEYFAWATTTTMSRYHRSADDVPDGLEIPHWSWDGLVGGTGTDDT